MARRRGSRAASVRLDEALLHDRRSALGMSQARLASAAGLSKATITFASRGNAVSEAAAQRIAAALGVPLVSILPARPGTAEAIKYRELETSLETTLAQLDRLTNVVDPGRIGVVYLEVPDRPGVVHDFASVMTQRAINIRGLFGRAVYVGGAPASFRIWATVDRLTKNWMSGLESEFEKLWGLEDEGLPGFAIAMARRGALTASVDGSGFPPVDVGGPADVPGDPYYRGLAAQGEWTALIRGPDCIGLGRDITSALVQVRVNLLALVSGVDASGVAWTWLAVEELSSVERDAVTSEWEGHGLQVTWDPTARMDAQRRKVSSRERVTAGPRV